MKETASTMAKIMTSRLANEKLTAFSPSFKYLQSKHKKVFPKLSRDFHNLNYRKAK